MLLNNDKLLRIRGLPKRGSSAASPTVPAAPLIESSIGTTNQVHSINLVFMFHEETCISSLPNLLLGSAALQASEAQAQPPLHSRSHPLHHTQPPRCPSPSNLPLSLQENLFNWLQRPNLLKCFLLSLFQILRRRALLPHHLKCKSNRMRHTNIGFHFAV